MPSHPATRLVPLLALAACDSSDNGVKVYNEAPNVEITYPSDGGTVDAGVEVTMAGTGSDPESSETDLTATWTVDGEVLCDSVALDAVGLTECTTVFDSGSYTIGLTITDPSGASNSASHSIYVAPSNAPTVEILEPTATGIYYADRATYFEGTVSDEEDASDALTVVWESGSMGDLGLPANASTAGVTSGEAVLSEGEHEITLRATDSDGLQATDTVTVTVLATNTAPTCGILSPTDSTYGDSGTEVEFSGVAADAEVASQFLTATWSSDRDGSLFTEAVSAAGETGFSDDGLSVGTHVIELEVVDDGGELCSDTVVYTVGSPPTVEITAPGDGDVANEGDLLDFVGTALDSEDAGVDLTIAWTSDLDGTLDNSPPPGDGSGTVGFVTDELSAGLHEIRLRATDSDGLYADAYIELTVNGLPSAPVVSVSPDPAYTGNDLTAAIDADSVDPEGATVSYGYDWTVDGVTAGITSATVPASATSRGEEWEVTVTPFDGYGTGPVATASVTVDNTPPSVDAAPTLTPDPAYEGDTLTCTAGVTSDADGDSVTSSYSWMVNGAAVAASSSTLGSSFFDAGDSVYCLQTPYDGYDSGTAVASNTVTISNTAPSVSSVAISPDPATAGDTLSCSYTFADADGDGDSSTIAWTVNGSSAGTGTTLSSGYVRGDTVTCTVTPNDGTDAGTPVADSITIDNSLPSVSGVTITPDPADTSDSFTCAVTTSSDVDGDTVSLSYAWYVNGASAGVSATTLSSSYTVKNDAVYCLVTPSDGIGSGTAEQSNVVTVGNTAPSVTSVTLSPSTPMTADTITASVSGSDADGDSITYTYGWYVNGSLAVTGSAASLGSSYFVRGDDVYVEVTPNDGDDDGSALSSSSVTVINSLPEAPELEFDPASPEQEIDDLFCEVVTDSDDDDGDSVSYTFTWTVDGASYTGATTTDHPGDTVPAADTVLGFDWICTATPNDGFANGTAESILVTVRDVTDPDAPTIDTPQRFRNDDGVDLTGTCEFGDCVDVVIDCDSSTVSQTRTVTCDSGDTWSSSFSGLARDETTLCTAYCVDASSNESNDSNTVSTDVCAPFDAYEDASGTGDSDAAAIDPWAAISEGAAAATISGNILGTDTVDWYVLDSDDDVAADRSATIDYYSLDVRLLDADSGIASTVYDMTVYKGSTAAASCSSTPGYTSYTDYWYDRADGSHSAPSDRRRCASSSASFNECEDMAETYYVKVERVSASVTSCAGYTLSVTNNGGVCDTSTECPY